jgi:hypothetical protein
MAAPLGLIRDTCPSWFAVADQDGAVLRGTASLHVNARDAVVRHDLEISLRDGAVVAREAEAGSRLPRRCSERHIEFDGSFCLGLGAGARIENETAASAWWRGLDKFLRLQRTANRTGVWPDQHALSHGEAGVHHQAAIDIATELGLDQEYEALVMGAPSQLDRFVNLLRRDGSRFRNGRAACDCDCGTVGRRRRLRRKCLRLRSILTLLAEERARKVKLAEFWEAQRRLGTVCCGTMATCPLRQAA